MATRQDWLKRPAADLNTMFENVKMKIGSYKTAYGLTDDWIARVDLICDTFTAAFATVMQNRASARDMNEWFENLQNAVPPGAPAPAAPVFHQITLPAGAFVGLLGEFRSMMGFFKSNAAYTDAAGENLMIVAPPADDDNTDNVTPDLTVMATGDNAIKVSYTRGDLSGIELQWRKAGETLWQMADKTTETSLTFTPENVTLPAKIELRAIYLQRNRRVGHWSPTFTVTLG